MNKLVRVVVFILFAVGALSGMVLGGAATIAGLEADFYFGFGYQADESLKDLECPLILTGDEIGTVSVTLSNSKEKQIEPLFQVDIGEEGMFRSYRDRMYIPVGESQTLQWTVSRDDVVFNHLILVKLFQFAAFKTPTRDGSCGILYLDVPFSGITVLIFIITLSVTGITLAIILWLTLYQSLPIYKTRVLRAMVVMGVTVILTMLTGILSIWMLGVLFFMISLLLIAEVIRSFIAAD